jgi:ADP-ribose pyrophosphatase YjhB (NUDIX family)
MSLKEKDLYFVAVKLFLEKGDTFLITKDIFNDGWDLPGGRIRRDEFDTSLEEVVARKVREELGDDVNYILKEPVVFFRHERVEAETGEQIRIFAIGYRAEYTGGELKLGDHHTKFEWVPISTFDPEKYFTGGWKKGVIEYLSKRREQND